VVLVFRHPAHDTAPSHPSSSVAVTCVAHTPYNAQAFIEDLFNANKIKVLFATETLAAGVNMPARTTVISTVTKRINSEVIKLKTSQLLQMAGRAGRRGKDTEGTVVIMRNRFEDVRMGHKILTSAVDVIKSHFKTSYGWTLKVRTFECRPTLRVHD